MSSLFVPPSFPAATLLPPPPADPPDHAIIPSRYRCAWQIEIGEAMACTFGVFAFNLQSSHSVGEWLMSASVQLAFLAAAERSKIPFAIAARTDPSATTRALALAGLLVGTGISAASLWQAVDTAFAPRSAAVEETRAKLEEARQGDAEANRNYTAANEAVKAAQKSASESTKLTETKIAAYAKSRVCDRYGRCHSDPTLKKSVAIGEAAEKTHGSAVGDANVNLAAIDTSTPAASLHAAELANRKAVRDDLYHHMAEDFFGETVSEETVLWVKRGLIGGASLFTALAGSLMALTAVKPARKAEAAAAEKTFEAPDAALVDLAAHVPAAFVHRVADEVEEKRREAEQEFDKEFAASALARPARRQTRARKPASPNQGKKRTNGDARRAPPSAPPPA